MLESKLPPQKAKKKSKIKISTLKNAGLILSLLVSLSLITVGSLQWRNFQRSQAQLKLARKSSAILPLLFQSPQQRASLLQEIAAAKKGSRDRSRARYLLAVDSLANYRGAAALTYLQGLERDYPLLAPQILLKTALAYRQNRQENEFQATLKHLIQTYPESPTVADALYLLNPKQLLPKFPQHPLTQAIASQLLTQQKKPFELLLLRAKYSREPNLNSIRDRLVLEHPAQLEPEDWEAIADGYWREAEHRKAADAYMLARSTPHNLYRAARGFHLNGNTDEAKRAYQRLIDEYHDARETGQALLYLASISGGDEAIVYLDKAIAKFPQNAPQAYLSKAVIHDAFDKSEAATLARQKLLKDYKNSATTIEYRWQTAHQLAAQGDKQKAWQWMQPVITAEHNSQNSEFAPKALYWTGKWAKELGKVEDAHRAFKRVLTLYPQSYWAWRSAVALGWDVGDFSSLRQLSPNLDFTSAYASLPMGSEALQELYFLRQYQDAWTLLQAEIEHPQRLSVNEQFTEGLMLLHLGQISQGMNQIWELAQREEPQEIEQWESLRQTTAYWHNLFPFPYRDKILAHARQEKINPLLIISVMRKESTFDPKIDSRVGAIGLMQIVPPTAEWVAEQIGLADYSLTEPEDNIAIGTWYLAHNHHRYEQNSLLAIASYNAGTGNVNQWLQRYDINDPDRFIEQIPYAETKDYVEGVFGNYWNYLRLYNPEVRKRLNGYIKPLRG